MSAIVLGAGVSGLVCAHQLKKKGVPTVVLEAASQAGGVICSKWVDGHLLEMGPNTVRPTSALLTLIDELGLRDEMLLADAKTPRFIQFKHTLHPVPMDPLSFMTSSLLSWRGKFKLLSEPFVFSAPQNDESLLSFVRRRLGDEAAERLLAPFVSGVWAGDANELSAEATFPTFVKFEREHGSLFRGLLAKKKEPDQKKVRGLLSFKNGLQTLPNAIAKFLGDALHLNESATEIKFDQNSATPWNVKTSKGSYSSKYLYISLPASVSAHLGNFLPESARTALNEIPHVSLTVFHFSVKKSSFKKFPHGFGYLIVPSEKEPILGCLWNSSVFPGAAPAEQFLLTVFARGTNASEEEAKQSIAKSLLTSGEIKTLAITKYERAIPQYTIGHLARIQKIRTAEKMFSGLTFIGNYLEGIAVGAVVTLSVQKSA